MRLSPCALLPWCGPVLAQVAVAARRLDRLDSLVKELTLGGAAGVLAVRMDVRDETSIKAGVRQASRVGKSGSGLKCTQYIHKYIHTEWVFSFVGFAGYSIGAIIACRDRQWSAYKDTYVAHRLLDLLFSP